MVASYSVKIGQDSPFRESGVGLNSAFQPLHGDPVLVQDYFSWVVNQTPALRGAGLRATKAAIRSTWGAQLGKAPGAKVKYQMDFPDDTRLASHDRTWVDFQMEVARELSKFKQSPMTNLAVTGKGFPRDFAKLTTSGAWSMNPSLSPRLDRIGKTDAKIPDSYLRILGLLTKIYTEKWEPAGVQQNNKSHSGILTNVYDKSEKVAKIIHCARAHGEDFAKALVDYDGDWFASNYGSFPVVKLTARLQLDVLGKERKGTDWTGQEIVADKSVPDEFSHGYEMNAMRERVAYAVDGLSNAMIAAAWSGWRSVALDAYPLTWHTSQDSDLLDPIKKYGHFELYDASVFDTSYTREELDKINESIEGFTELGHRYQDAIGHLPLVITSDVKGESGAYMFNNGTYAAGHQSGVCYVSDYNKIRGTAQWLYGLVKIGYLKSDWSDERLILSMKQILKHGDTNFALINQGDDTMALAKSRASLDKWCKAVENLEFVNWELDGGRKMIGKVLYQAEPGAELKIIPDAVTLVEKLLINEHSVHSKHRAMSSAGNRERIRMLQMECPGGPEVLRAIDKVAYKHFGADLDTLYKRTAYKDEVNLGAANDDFDLSQFNEATRTFILDPDSIHYKIRAEDVDPRVFKAVNATIMPEDAAWILRRMGFMKPEVHELLVPRSAENEKRYVTKSTEMVYTLTA